MSMQYVDSCSMRINRSESMYGTKNDMVRRILMYIVLQSGEQFSWICFENKVMIWTAFFELSETVVDMWWFGHKSHTFGCLCNDLQKERNLVLLSQTYRKLWSPDGPDIFPVRNEAFLQDNYPIHSAKLVK